MNVPIVFDIGGTKMRVAAVRSGHLDEIHIVDTPQNPKEAVSQLQKLARNSAHGDSISELVGDVAGIVKGGTVFKSPHLPKWNGWHLAGDLKTALGAPVTLFNDAALVGLGEYYYGAGKHAKTLAYITVSTGVGGARIVDGHIDQGEYNAEIGHQNVDGETLENQISGFAVLKKYGVPPQELNDPAVYEQLADILAKGLYDNVLHWSPDTIVLGGAMITGEKNTIPVDRVKHTLEDMITTIYPHAPRVLKAKLSKLGGLYGAMAYLNNRNLG